MNAIKRISCPKHPGLVCGREGCPEGLASCCGWDAAEDRRRRALPLVRDKKTGLLRKFIGERCEGNQS